MEYNKEAPSSNVSLLTKVEAVVMATDSARSELNKEHHRLE